jgi:hypothetical protein
MQSFVCIACLNKDSIVYTKLTQGIATSVTSKCGCDGQKASIKAKIWTTAKDYDNYEAKLIPRLRPSADYEINVQLMLTLRAQGKGLRDGRRIDPIDSAVALVPELLDQMVLEDSPTGAPASVKYLMPAQDILVMNKGWVYDGIVLRQQSCRMTEP